MRALIATLTALMLFATTPVAAGDFEDGLAAHLPGMISLLVHSH